MSNQFNMQCPSCASAEHLDVVAQVWVRLTADGTDADESRDGSHEWDDDSACSCACGWHGKVGDAKSTDVAIHRHLVVLGAGELDEVPSHMAFTAMTVGQARDKFAGVIRAGSEVAGLDVDISFVFTSDSPFTTMLSGSLPYVVAVGCLEGQTVDTVKLYENTDHDTMQKAFAHDLHEDDFDSREVQVAVMLASASPISIFPQNDE